MEQLSHAIRPFVYFVPVDGGYLYTLHVYGRKASWNKMQYNGKDARNY